MNTRMASRKDVAGPQGEPQTLADERLRGERAGPHVKAWVPPPDDLGGVLDST